jgi:hypothetical protein
MSTLLAPELWPRAPALVAKRPPWAKGEDGEDGPLSEDGAGGLVGDDRSAPPCRGIEPEREAIELSDGERLPSSSRAWYAGRATVESFEPAIREASQAEWLREGRKGRGGLVFGG